MADISIKPVNNINIAPPPAVRNNNAHNAGVSRNAPGVKQSAGAEAAGKAREAAEAQRERSAEIRREQLDDVIAVSKDGDTVQATDKSMERLAEDAFGHMEVRKESPAENNNASNAAPENGAGIDEATERAMEESAETAIEGTGSRQAIQESTEQARLNGTRTEEAIAESTAREVNGTSRTEEAMEAGQERVEQEEAEEKYEQKLESYEGISDMKLEQMYLQGEISKTDYDQEMESRKEEREAEAEEDSAFSDQMTGAAVLQESGRRDLNQIETAFSEEANNNISAEDRMEIIETLDAQATQNFNTQAAANVITDDNASGEETVKKIVFS